MRRMTSKWIGFLAIFSLSGLAASCDFAAPEGFWAPSGSSVTVVGSAASASVAPGSTATVYVTVSVKVPSAGETVPGNKIYVRGVCTDCKIYDWVAGDGRAEMDESKLVEMGTTYAFATNSWGSYTVAIRVEAPSVVFGTSAAYTAKFLADIAAATGSVSVTVSEAGI
jgi:hypothetical protein